MFITKSSATADIDRVITLLKVVQGHRFRYQLKARRPVGLPVSE